MLTARQTVDTYFLEARHMLLEVAALLDRHAVAVAREAGPRANGSAAHAAAEEKLAVLRQALATLAADEGDGDLTVKLLELFARV